MGRLDRFVDPKTIRIDLSHGDWIEIKKELTAGETKQMLSAGLKQMTASDSDDPKFDIDIPEMSFAKVLTYLVDWSFAKPSLNSKGEQIVDSNGKPEVVPVVLTPEAIRSLKPSHLEEIEEAIDRHVEQLEKEKKVASGKSKSAATSPS